MPNMTKKNMKRMKISKSVGSELSKDWTSLLIPGIELIVLKGLKIRITLIAERLLVVANLLIQPVVTTTKSSYTTNTELSAHKTS